MKRKLLEYKLNDSCPVKKEFLYVCDDHVVASPIDGTVEELKEILGVKVVLRCDSLGRHLNKMDADLHI